MMIFLAVNLLTAHEGSDSLLAVNSIVSNYLC